MHGDTSPSSLETHLGYWLRLVSNAVSQSFARKLESEGVTVAEWVFLRALYDADQITPTRLAQEMGMTKGAISRLADRLAEKALVERRADPDDRRAQTLALSGTARALVPQLARLADANDAEFFDALSQQEREMLAQLLQKIARDRNLTTIPLD